ncbi:MAG: AAA family ATPase [Sphingobacterium sp.]|jgi:ABC-type cobalamin/Fe3+-siderophores transport system ATPase subunit|nr:AAA family ATPase [Sphingobacterium sp.]
MIISYSKGTKTYNLYDLKKVRSKNIFTVIVGKNGSGKSRLLNGIIEPFLAPDLFRDHAKTKASEIAFTQPPQKIIAVSTSPYDKFPISKPYFLNKKYSIDNNDTKSNYSYVGIRDIRSSDFSLGFMSKIIKELLYVQFEKEDYGKIVRVLNYLGYSDELFLTFEIVITRGQINKLLDSPKHEYILQDIFMYRGPGKINISFFDFPTRSSYLEKLDKLCAILEKYNLRHFKGRQQVIMNAKFIQSDIQMDDLLFLMEAGIVKLRDVGIRKLSSQKVYRISEASSGEQCIFTTFLGISSNIVDNSLIVIDEPEISLHPEWQEKYITLLIDTFQNYKNCHFIIATHSPQLVSRLSTENCYVLQMDNGELKNAADIANNSVDFQLANVFESPGFKNEYLARISFSIISKVGKTNKFDKEDLNNFEVLKSQIKNLQKNDPILGLFELIKELRRNG